MMQNLLLWVYRLFYVQSDIYSWNTNLHFFYWLNERHKYICGIEKFWMILSSYCLAEGLCLLNWREHISWLVERSISTSAENSFQPIQQKKLEYLGFHEKSCYYDLKLSRIPLLSSTFLIDFFFHVEDRT